MKQDKNQYQATPNIPFITRATANFSQEHFGMNIFSGNKVYRFACSPKHAKRIKILLERKIEEYEKEHGKLETELPKKEGSKQKDDLGF